MVGEGNEGDGQRPGGQRTLMEQKIGGGAGDRQRQESRGNIKLIKKGT